MFLVILLFFPLFFFVIYFLFSFLFRRKAVFYILFSSYLSLLFFIVLCLFIFIMKYNLTFFVILSNWVLFSLLNLDWCILVDSLMACMLVVVLSIFILVHIYSVDYMRFDLHFFKFISFLSLFTFFMLVLVVSANFIQLFVGWEGVGLCSFLLISFWNSRIQANKSAIKAMLVNRIGDFGLMLSFLFIFYFFKSLNFFVIFPSILMFFNISLYFFDYFYINLYNFICFFIFLGAVGKSAQFGLHVWLPDAMEGPTPVSALIHAATMVTAGIFIIIRCSFFFEFSSMMLYIITILGALTAFYSATVGLVQNDIKRVIAFSTCSQLGYMILSCGLSNYNVGLFHLMTHAFFKALLFLSAGCVIHSLFNEQDMRKMGGLYNILPLTYSMFFIGSLALIGFPYLAGFYSKDLILELAFAKYTLNSHYCYWLGTLSALFTAFYSLRLLCLVFLVDCNVSKCMYSVVYESSSLMLFVLVILGFASIFIGFFLKDLVVGVGSFFFCNSIFNFSYNLLLLDSEFIPIYIRVLPLLFSLCGCFIAFLFYILCDNLYYIFRVSRWGRFIYVFLNRRWFIDKIYSEFFSQNFLMNCYYFVFFYIDRGILEKMGSMLFYRYFTYWGYSLNSMFSGFFTEYMYFFFFFILFYILLQFIFIDFFLIINLIFGLSICMYSFLGK